MSSSYANTKHSGIFLDIECTATIEDEAKLELIFNYLKGLYTYAFSKLFHDYRDVERSKHKANLTKNYPSRDFDIIRFFDTKMYNVEDTYKKIKYDNREYRIRLHPDEIPTRVKERTVYYAGNDLYNLFDRYVLWTDVNKTKLTGLPEFVDAKIFLDSKNTHYFVKNSKFSWYFDPWYPNMFQNPKVNSFEYLMNGKLTNRSGFYEISPGEYLVPKFKLTLMAMNIYDIVRLKQYIGNGYVIHHSSIRKTNLVKNVKHEGRSRSIIYNLNLHLIEDLKFKGDRPQRLMYNYKAGATLSYIHEIRDSKYNRDYREWWDYPNDEYAEYE